MFTYIVFNWYHYSFWLLLLSCFLLFWVFFSHLMALVPPSLSSCLLTTKSCSLLLALLVLSFTSQSSDHSFHCIFDVFLIDDRLLCTTLNFVVFIVWHSESASIDLFHKTHQIKIKKKRRKKNEPEGRGSTVTWWGPGEQKRGPAAPPSGQSVQVLWDLKQKFYKYVIEQYRNLFSSCVIKGFQEILTGNMLSNLNYLIVLDKWKPGEISLNPFYLYSFFISARRTVTPAIKSLRCDEFCTGHAQQHSVFTHFWKHPHC